MLIFWPIFAHFHQSQTGLQQGSGGRGGQDHLTRAQRQRARHWALPTSGAHYTCVVGALVCCSHSPLQQKPGKPDLCCSLPPSPPSSPYLGYPLHHPQLTAAASHRQPQTRSGECEYLEHCFLRPHLIFGWSYPLNRSTDRATGTRQLRNYGA